MITYPDLQSRLLDKPGIWLVTGVAGFIGSHLLEALLQMDQHVIGLDNLSTGRRDNLDSVHALVTEQQWSRFQFRHGDISSLDDCRHAMMFSIDSGETLLADYVLHQAALCSVARSIEEPTLTNDYNINGFLNILVAARDAGVKRLVYASSSAVYGDTPGLPKEENGKLRPLSPYAITKYVDELYADVFAKLFHVKSVGLRYFNIFGVRQDPQGAYAAVIPKWIDSMISANPVTIFGDGETSRDFCHVSNVVQANLLAACAPDSAYEGTYNVGTGRSTTLNQLYGYIRNSIINEFPYIPAEPHYTDFRTGDIRHSLANIAKAREQLGYMPDDGLSSQLSETVHWYLSCREHL
ncbi:SDR family oxidoreductase [Beijerinckia mobilis]|uniref:SDR family oxidoreductase n=1 Tax=Beijerinckia mobilis TaxID=231434 RepID=UPI000551BB1D|nr:SDR family oxidoreductase [Beijerinckia mobilis]